MTFMDVVMLILPAVAACGGVDIRTRLVVIHIHGQQIDTQGNNHVIGIDSGNLQV